MKKILALSLLLMGLFLFTTSALAQAYFFQLPQKTVDVYWEADGTLTLEYTYVFKNDPQGHAIDFVDVGTPNSNYSESDVTAEINGSPVAYVSKSEFQGEGSDGFAVALGNRAIPPGGTGTVHVRIVNIRRVLYPDSQDKQYASAVLIPNYFVSSVVSGQTDTTVTFHLPPGVQSSEPRWHKSPAGFPSEPETGIDSNGRIYYTWRNPQGSGSTKYTFGASFPQKYIPASAIVRFDLGAWILENFWLVFWVVIIGFIVLSGGLNAYTGHRRQMQYLPPKISIEGHGIKRGLTAVESAILLEQPLDKVLTMILFGLVKKGAVQVVTQDPLKIEALKPEPEDLNPYEKGFIEAFELQYPKQRFSALSRVMVDLVKSVAEKMKGFSRRESIEYYKNIVDRAWAQVQEADTPEVKSQKFDELMEWTMLDRNYDDRTRDIFHSQPVYIPIWWGRWSPAYRTATSSPSVSRPTPSGIPTSSGGTSLPHLPGSDFAASIVNGVSNFSAGVIGNMSEFTSSVTQKTNPLPISTSSSSRSGSSRGGSSSGGGHSCACACACACAGCACACAGGGR